MIRTMTLVAAAAILAVLAPSAQAQGTSTNRARGISGAQGTTSATQGTTTGAQGTTSTTRGATTGAQGTTSATQGATTGTQGAAVNDALFAVVAAASGMTELTISELGRQKASDPELKRFSEQMIQDHTRLNRELMTLASQKQMAIPAQLDARGQFCSQSLAGAPSQEFDACYAKAQLTAHLEAIETFKAESERGMDPDVRALATRALPILKGHLKMIKPIAMRYHDKEQGQESSDGHGQGSTRGSTSQGSSTRGSTIHGIGIGTQGSSGTRGNDR